MLLYVTDFCSVGRVVYLNGELLPLIFRGVVAVLCLVRYYLKVREDVAIVAIFVEAFGSIALFSLHTRGLSLRQHARQQAGSSLLAFTNTVRFVRCRQHSRQQPL